MFPDEDQYAYAQQGAQHPNLVPLPRPGGPVDPGIWQESQRRRGITPLPQPGFQEAGVLSHGGGGGSGGAWEGDPWARPPLTPDVMTMLRQMRQQFPSPIQQRVSPGQARMRAVRDAHMQAIKRMKKYQHQRRASGRR